MEEWGYLWAHRLLEDVFVRPNFDIQNIVDTIIRAKPENLDLSVEDATTSGLNRTFGQTDKAKTLEELQNKYYQQTKAHLIKAKK